MHKTEKQHCSAPQAAHFNRIYLETGNEIAVGGALSQGLHGCTPLRCMPFQYLEGGAPKACRKALLK